MPKDLGNSVLTDQPAPTPGARPRVERGALARAALPVLSACLASAGIVLLFTGGIDALGAGTLLAVGAVLIAADRFWAVRHRDARLSEIAIAARALRHDPARVFVTGPMGDAIDFKGIDATTTLSIADHLGSFVADPAHLIAQIVDEVARLGRTTRTLRRGDGRIEITVFPAGRDDSFLIWRLSSLPAPDTRVGFPADLPIVQRRGEAITMNKAAHDEIARSPGLLTALSMADMSTFGPPRLQVLRDGVETARSVLVCTASADSTLTILLPETLDLSGQSSADAMDQLPVALLGLNRSGRIVQANAAALRLLEIDLQAPLFLSDLVDDLGRPVSAWLDDAWAGRSVGKPEIVRARLQRGEVFLQIVLQHGSDETLLAVLNDATEHKSLEAKFVQSQKMQAIGQLAGGVAHDFNNLLTAISGHCDLLLLDRDRHDPDYDDLLQIYQNTNRAAALVRQLLAYSRKQKLQTEPVDIETLLEDVAHLLTRLVGEKIAVKLRHDPDLAPILADPRQLEQVLMNLVVNARDAMPMGGTIEIVTRALVLDRPRQIGRVTLPPGSYAQIKVIDGGVGMSQDICEKIFEPFFTTKKTGEGTGLGLSTVYGIVKQMGGYVFVDSVEGAGTTFSLYFVSDGSLTLPERPAPTAPVPAAAPPVSAGAARLRSRAATPRAGVDAAPVARPSAAPRLPRAEDAATPAPRATILLVEDEAPVRNFAARALRLKGYGVIEACDGEQALAILSQTAQPIDLFVTDVIMPALDGPAWVARAFDPETPQAHDPVPVVFMSGYAEETVNEAVKRTARSVFLSKPFSLEALLTTVDQQLSR